MASIAPASAAPANAAAPQAVRFQPGRRNGMRVTIDNIPPATQDRADVTITYGPTIETYRQVSLDPKAADFIETRIGTASQPVSGLVTVKARSASKFTRASHVTLEISAGEVWNLQLYSAFLETLAKELGLLGAGAGGETMQIDETAWH